MFCYELKKVLSKVSSRIALVVLLTALLIVSFLAITSVSYTKSDGSSVSGTSAADSLRQEKEKWTGYITEDVLRQVITENTAVNQSPEYQSDNVTDNNIAYSRKQGFSDIRELINMAFSGFQDYDYYRVDSVTADEVGELYGKRVESLREWLYSDEISDTFTESEKQYLIQEYEKMDTPLYYTYADGWKALLEYAPTLIMLTVLVTGFLVSGIFPGEFSLKADSVYFSSRYGRNRGVRAKIAAGFCLQTALYWTTMLLYTGIVLFSLGAEGGECAVQTWLGGWKSFYNITLFQDYALTLISGYAGELFILSLSMLISAKTRSAVLASALPFIVLFVPSILSSVNVLSKLLGLLPDQLLQISTVINTFNLYQIGGIVMGAVPLLFVLYPVLFVLMLPGTYFVYSKAEIK